MRNITTILVIAAGTFLVNLDASIVNIALPTLCTDLGASTQDVAWVVLIYLCALGSLLLFSGKLGDALGSKRIFITGFLIFSVGSLICAYAHQIHIMYLGRLVQGIGAACIMANFGAILLQNLPSDYIGRAFGLNTVLGGIGYAMGAPLGGWLIHSFGWRWIFLINIPVGIVAIIASVIYLKKDQTGESEPERFDLYGLFLSVIAVTLFLLILTRGFGESIFSAPYAVAVIIFLLCTMAFVRQELKTKHPLLEIPLFLKKGILACIAANMGFVIVLSGLNFLFPFYFMEVLQIGVGRTGFFLMFFPVVSIAVSPLAGYLADRFGPKTVEVRASALAVLTTASFYFFSPDISSALIIIIFIGFGIALAMFFTANITLFMSNAPADRAGMFTAVASSGTTIGAALGVSIFGNFLETSKGSAILSRALQIDSGFHYAVFLATAFALTAFGASMISKSGQPSLPEEEHKL
ncbi:MFS transporter [Maridesulfovibrio ferrireducens]|uniref:MFS transporter n=1 Tax=Maridesulfovibrio ferrireducens TaxID=246191 RepID=UPI001A2A6D93|nr:MFS transporter [Maridesulfovibrio ferrireducens]MBI9111961.1 MFS transporter [Maridesulfovibrio ferrireducens]